MLWNKDSDDKAHRLYLFERRQVKSVGCFFGAVSIFFLHLYSRFLIGRGVPGSDIDAVDLHMVA